MDVIEGLLRIKRIREESREHELRRARRELDEALAALREAQEQQSARDEERARREEALYADVTSRLVVVREIDDLHVELGVMKEEAVRDEQTVEQARGQREQRREAVTAATDAWRIASRAKSKFADLLKEQQLQRDAEDEMKAALELEEHPVRPRDPDLTASAVEA